MSEIKFTDKGIECNGGGFKIVDESLITALKTEQQELLKKIEKSRDNNDFGLYKNLIRALTEVVHLLHEEEERKSPKTITTTNLVVQGDMLLDNNKFLKDIESILKREELID
jgi:hypothetical protein